MGRMVYFCKLSALVQLEKGETVLVNENIIPKFNDAQCKHPSTCIDALNLQK